MQESKMQHKCNLNNAKNATHQWLLIIIDYKLLVDWMIFLPTKKKPEKKQEIMVQTKSWPRNLTIQL